MEVKQSRTAQETIQRRMRNSGGEEASQTIKSGDGVRRVFHNIHLHGHQAQHGPDNVGEGSIIGERRTSANPKGEI